MATSVKAIARLEPEEMRSYLLTHPISRGGRLWCDRIIEGVDQGDRTALRLFGEAMKWTGAQVNIVALMTERFRVSSEGQLVELVEAGRRFEQIKSDVEDSWEAHRDNAVELLKGVLRQHPECRASVIAQLGGVVPETNGGTH